MTERAVVVWVTRVAFATLVLVAWQLLAASAGDLFLAGPLAVAQQGVAMIATGELLRYAAPTATVLLAGAGLALVAGIPLGLAMGRWQRLYWLGEGPINLFYTTPLVALIPVLLVILGFGRTTKIVIVFLFAVFPVVINTAAGVRAVDRDLLELARSLRAPEWTVWRDILLPGALPFILTGIRLMIGRALIGAVVAEFYAGAEGLGYLIVFYSNRLQVVGALVPVIVLVALGVASASALKWLQRRLTPWQVGG